jgi:drug/metabolite transporter (DMT)-like permease
MVMVGFFFGSWQVVMRASGINNPFVAAFILNAATLAMVTPFAVSGLGDRQIFGVAGLVALAAGFLNGLGHIFFQKLVLSKTEDLTRFGAVVPAVVILVAVIGGVTFYAESLTWQKGAGIALIVLGIVAVSWK